jgi:hypothetical protein
VKGPAESRTSVTVPRWFLASLGGAALAGIVGVAFLIGRESGRRTSPAAHAAQAASAPTLAPAPPPSASAIADREPTTASGPVAAAPLETLAPASVSLAAAPSTRLPDEATREAVARYFREVEAVQSRSKSWTDPEDFAQALVEKAAKGDSSALDALLANSRQVRQQLAAIAAPEPCRECHERSLALLDDAIALLSQLGEKISTNDLASLQSLSARGEEIQRRTKELNALAGEIKRSFGVS